MKEENPNLDEDYIKTRLVVYVSQEVSNLNLKIKTEDFYQ